MRSDEAEIKKWTKGGGGSEGDDEILERGSGRQEGGGGVLGTAGPGVEVSRRWRRWAW